MTLHILFNLNILYDISPQFNTEPSIPTLVLLLHGMSPASVFFVAVYSEALFACLQYTAIMAMGRCVRE